MGRVMLKNSKLAPKHEGSFKGAYKEHSIWYVYTLVLRNHGGKPLAVKVGYSNDPFARENAHNASLATEVTGLRWAVDMKQPTPSEDIARDVEQAVLNHFDQKRLPSNGEILGGVDHLSVGSAIAIELRRRSLM